MEAAPSIPSVDLVRFPDQLLHRIGEFLGGAGERPRMTVDQPLKAGRVHRQVWRTRARTGSFIIKRFTSERSCVERMAIERWLPALHMSQIPPALIAVAAEDDGRTMWHLYEDLGDSALDVDDLCSPAQSPIGDRGFLSAMASDLETDRLDAALGVMALLHGSSEAHPLLGECRRWGGDLGADFLRTSVGDAIRALESLSEGPLPLSISMLHTRERLLEILRRLAAEVPDRCRFLEAHGGPECLLHGDFGVRNVVAHRSGRNFAGRLIDWDHAGVGPACYDLSTFLTQLPARQRRTALERYCALRRIPAPSSSSRIWNRLFDTSERSRLANCVIWPALSARDGEGDTAVQSLARIADWFEALGPVLPDPEHANGEARLA